MSLTNAAEQSLLDLLFLNTDWANIGDAGGLQNSAAAGNFYISLQQGMARRLRAAFGGLAAIAAALGAMAWFALKQQAVGTDSSGAGNLIMKGALTSSLSISNGIQPQFAAGALTATVD